ncbi:VOC family protein [Sulfitobacter sp. LCG007]
MKLDHIAVSGESLEAAADCVEAALGVPLGAGGKHDVFFTHNRLLGLEEGLYLEAIAADPQAPSPGRPRWFALDRFEGPPRLTNWICRSDALEAELARMPAGSGAPVDLRRGDLHWRMAVPESGVLPFDNCAPALIEWQTQTHPAMSLARSGVRLRRLTVSHPRAEQLKAELAPLLSDTRVAYEAGVPGLVAAFDTPHGPRELGA